MSLNGLHILLAEDNPTNQMVAVQMLESLGAQVTLAVDGLEALDLARRGGYDLGLIDIEMPKLSGTEVIRRIRSGPPPLCDMPLIALTAYVMREHRDAIDAAGADGVIAKPILSIEQLGHDILRHAGRRRSGEAPPVPAPSETAPADAQAGPGRAIDMRIFRGLETSIGPAAVRDLLGKMDRDVLTVRERIRAAIPAFDRRAIREATHVLVAVAGSVGAVKLQYDAQCLNSAAHSGEITDMAHLARVVVDGIDVLREFIRSKQQG